MKRLILFVVAILFIGGIAQAQDPGIPDSIIVGDVAVETTSSFAFVPVWAVTDDSVAFYNLPLAWDAPFGGVSGASGTQYFFPLTSWDEKYDTLMQAEGYFRMLGWADVDIDSTPNPVLKTNGQRTQCWIVRFQITPNRPRQLVSLDTTFDNRNGSLIMGLSDGVSEITPKFVRGWIRIGAVGVDDQGQTLPTDFVLGQNYPNPFNPETNIEFSLPRQQDVNLAVYNLLGQQVRTLVNGSMPAGQHTVRWDGRNDSGANVPSGIYFYKIYTNEFSQTNKMVLVR